MSKPLDPDRLIKAMQALLAQVQPAIAESQAAAECRRTAPGLTRRPAAIDSDETPPISIDALFDRCMGDGGTVTMILDEFELQAVAITVWLKSLRQCVAKAATATAIARVAVYALAEGASGVLSADALSDIAFKLERMGRTGVLAEDNLLLTQLDDEVRRCIGYLPTARAAIADRAKV